MTLKHPPGRNWKEEPSQLHAVFVADKQRKRNTACASFLGGGAFHICQIMLALTVPWDTAIALPPHLVST